MWKAGVFEIPNLGDALGDDAENFDIGLSLINPPGVEGVPGNPIKAKIHLGPYLGTIATEPGEQVKTLRAVAWAEAEIRLENGEITFGDARSIRVERIALTIDGAGEAVEGQAEFEEAFRELVQDVIAQALDNAIPGLPIPEFVVPDSVPGAAGVRLGLDGPSLRGTRNHLIIDGNFGQIGN